MMIDNIQFFSAEEVEKFGVFGAVAGSTLNDRDLLGWLGDKPVWAVYTYDDITQEIWVTGSLE